jgi:GNAT superfamily N-acetyltransferase
MSDFDIRPADHHGLEALIQELGQESFFRDRFARQLKRDGRLLVAWLDGRPIGDVYLWLEPAEEREIHQHLHGVPLLTNLEIHPDHRERGYGTKLIEAAEQWLRGQGWVELALAVEVKNTRAHSLYVHLGYEEWKHGLVMCDPFPGSSKPDSEKCHIMVKDLTRVANTSSRALFRVTRSVSRDRAALPHG